MCIYCTYRERDGWATLLEYDDVYQEAMAADATTESTHGFHDSWDDLKDELAL
ncbi:hypothetical protein SAMN05444422_102406 [Halobiforma haloterrestris]|uniref:Uncharacterized protein n=2 Tax=Natronobacterium TaxID=2256 RepID=M0LYR6_NATLA|nr:MULTISPECIES: hypothetical protein [Halobiforma]EMA37484.1 hypothetical protein C445_01316 [Halobiforma lacisalsi AJ5]SFB85415.1 hypothetical protein SAMN05444422_102406 [Halobiforma haloterrestris]